MVSPHHAGGWELFSEFVCDLDLLGREVTDEQKEGFIHAAASALTGLVEKAAEAGRPFQTSVFRGGRIRGSTSETALPSGDLWRIDMFVFQEPVQQNLLNVLRVVRADP